MKYIKPLVTIAMLARERLLNQKKILQVNKKDKILASRITTMELRLLEKKKALVITLIQVLNYTAKKNGDRSSLVNQGLDPKNLRIPLCQWIAENIADLLVPEGQILPTEGFVTLKEGSTINLSSDYIFRLNKKLKDEIGILVEFHPKEQRCFSFKRLVEAPVV